MGAVQNAMQRDGLDPSIMDLDPTKSVASQMKKEDNGPPLKDDPKYSKYFKMLKMVSCCCRYIVTELFTTLCPDLSGSSSNYLIVTIRACQSEL